MEQVAQDQAKEFKLSRYADDRRKHFEAVATQARKAVRKYKKGTPQKAAAKRRLARAEDKVAFWKRRRDKHIRLRAKLKALRKDLKHQKARWVHEQQQVNWNGCPSLTSQKILRVARFVNRRVRLAYITATTNGTHAPGSWHYFGHAIDYGSDRASNNPEKKVQQELLDKFGASYFLELFGPLGWYVKNGVLYQGHFPGHTDHTHAAA